ARDEHLAVDAAKLLTTQFLVRIGNTHRAGPGHQRIWHRAVGSLDTAKPVEVARNSCLSMKRKRRMKIMHRPMNQHLKGDKFVTRSLKMNALPIPEMVA